MHELLVNRLFKPAQEKVWLGPDRSAMTIAVDLGRKANKQTHKKQIPLFAIKIDRSFSPLKNTHNTQYKIALHT